MTKSYLKKVISEEICAYFEKNSHILEEGGLSSKEIEKILLENLEKNNGIR
tara:strand:+ start:449 stop:601 length:153 start_codon:yes stop_codon:yes gene_type:complete